MLLSVKHSPACECKSQFDITHYETKVTQSMFLTGIGLVKVTRGGVGKRGTT
jgi:hypothetical protein